MSEDYLMTGEQYKEIVKQLKDAELIKVVYNKDKLKMAEDTIDAMRTQIKLTKNALARIKGCGCRNN